MKSHYTEFDKGQVLSLKNEGYTYRDISKKIGISVSTVWRIIKRYDEFGSVERKTGSGRKKVLKNQDLSLIKNFFKTNSLISSYKIANKLNEERGLKITARTVRNFLKINGFRAVTPIRKPHLTPKHMDQRLKIAENWLFLGKSYWNDVIYSDETSFSYFNDAGRFKVWKSDDTKTPINLTKKFGYRKIMVWGCFSSKGVGKLHFIDGIMDAIKYVSILATNLPEMKAQLACDVIKFQQDNDPKHTSRLAKRYFQTNNINVLPWPSQSPDLNPIENLWAIIKYELRGKSFSSHDELKAKIVEIWNTITPDLCKKLSVSMNKRIIECIRNKGKHTSY